MTSEIDQQIRDLISCRISEIAEDIERQEIQRKLAEYSQETKEAIRSTIESLKDIVGYHFKWCRLAENSGSTCSCGMAELRQASYILKEE